MERLSSMERKVQVSHIDFECHSHSCEIPSSSSSSGPDDDGIEQINFDTICSVLITKTGFQSIYCKEDRRAHQCMATLISCDF